MALLPPAAGLDVVAIAARAYERDRYLTALLAPAAARPDLIALAAFAGEIARIPGYVSEPVLGEIRLQWWRDALDAQISGTATSGHPIADALGRALQRHRLDSTLLHGLIDAHSARLEAAPFADLPALADNLAASEAAQFTLAGRVLGSAAADPALIHDAGQAYGLARLLIELPATLAEQRCLLPTNLLAAHGATLDRLGEPEALERLGDIVRQLAATADGAAQRVRGGFRAAPPATRNALLPVALVRPYLQACQRGGLGAVQAMDIAPLTRVWRLWLAHRLGRL